MTRIALLVVGLFAVSQFTGCGTNGATEANLREAAISEQGQSLVYHDYARKAIADGYPDIAKLFTSIAMSEQIHTQAFYDILRKTQPATAVGSKPTTDSTLTNLYHALANQTYDANNYFPDMVRAAATQKAVNGEKLFKLIIESEKTSIKWLEIAIQSIETPDSIAVALPESWIFCQHCGAIWPNLPMKCNLCKKYIK